MGYPIGYPRRISYEDILQDVRIILTGYPVRISQQDILTGYPIGYPVRISSELILTYPGIYPGNLSLLIPM